MPKKTNNTIQPQRAKKSLGQNFLRSPYILRSFVKSAEVKEGEWILEVGPGRGAITKELLGAGARVVAVEKDEVLAEALREKFSYAVVDGSLIVVADDILHINPEEYFSGSYTIVGSIPYYITGVFLRTALAFSPQPQRISLIIQKEVARRIVARDAKESILSLSVKAFGDPAYIKTIKAKEFSPSPKVDSAILVISAVSDDFFNGFSKEEFFAAIKVAFSQKRKRAVTTLSMRYDKDTVVSLFERVGISQNARAEDIALQEWGKILYALSREE
ncbi:MAG: 16S rRNA (adenine(1518)-N(6)/adenine(1519)-N(6))-dimethyltransferase RsmA [Candidatus Paceibacterota bacterium]